MSKMENVWNGNAPVYSITGNPWNVTITSIFFIYLLQQIAFTNLSKVYYIHFFCSEIISQDTKKRFSGEKNQILKIWKELGRLYAWLTLSNCLIMRFITLEVVCYWAKNIYKRKEKAKTMGASLDKKEIVKEHIILSWIISDWRIKEILERKSSKNHWQPFLYFYSN